MAPPVKLSSALPEDRMNGLWQGVVINNLLAQPRSAVYAIVVLTNGKTETNNDTGAVTPVVRIRHIEIVGDDAASKVSQFLQEAHQARTGEMMLPFERGEDVPAPHDPETGDGSAHD
jgi:hypothetical protein